MIKASQNFAFLWVHSRGLRERRQIAQILDRQCPQRGYCRFDPGVYSWSHAQRRLDPLPGTGATGRLMHKLM